MESLPVDIQLHIARFVEHQKPSKVSAFVIVRTIERSSDFLQNHMEFKNRQPLYNESILCAFNGVRTIAHQAPMRAAGVSKLGVICDVPSIWKFSHAWHPRSQWYAAGFALSDGGDMCVHQIKVEICIQSTEPVVQAELTTKERVLKEISRQVTPVPLYPTMHGVSKLFTKYDTKRHFLPLYESLVIGKADIIGETYASFDRVRMSVREDRSILTPFDEWRDDADSAHVPTLIRPAATTWEEQ